MNESESGHALRQRRNQLKRQAKFLAAFVQDATVLHAAKRAGMNRSDHQRWMREDPEYRAAFAQAQEDARQALETEARRRALVGVLEPVWHQGRRVGAVRKYSDTLLIFLLKAARPDVYRERVEHSGSVGLRLELSRYSDEQLEQLERLVQLGLPATGSP